ncbi:glycosyltransferase [Echinicola shivajiensis]|uniref:glycosyltransferase n=1 Tax=Echinicola shivajiensis TaxID=1035916 RepID=UPI001BFCB250|nr:glycosyltransferase [Echinicola shivajiensis]
MGKALVSIICICHNQEDFVVESLDSVLSQSYDALELIIVDNGSTDASKGKIHAWLKEKELLDQVRTIFYPNAINYCQVFNEALRLANGDYIIDLSGDDVLFPEHVESSVKALESTPMSALCSSNAVLYNEETKKTSRFFPFSNKYLPVDWRPNGNVYREVVRNYCLCTPTMVFRSSILKKEGGYDENLVYEDFDIIVRLARKYSFAFSPHIGVKKRLHQASFAREQYKAHASRMLWSTYSVCQKIAEMNQSKEENLALAFRCKHEAKHALASANFEVAQSLLELAGKSGAKGLGFIFLKAWAFLKFDLSFVYRVYTQS